MTPAEQAERARLVAACRDAANDARELREAHLRALRDQSIAEHALRAFDAAHKEEG